VRYVAAMHSQWTDTPGQRGGGGVSEDGRGGVGCLCDAAAWCWMLSAAGTAKLHYAALQDPGAGMEASV